jgi:hypothetical protein
MAAQFSPFDPIVWLIFAVFVVCIFAIVKLFHLKYPNYPSGTQKTATLRLATPAPMEKKTGQPAVTLPGQYESQAGSRDGMDAKP